MNVFEEALTTSGFQILTQATATLSVVQSRPQTSHITYRVGSSVCSRTIQVCPCVNVACCCDESTLIEYSNA